MMCGRFALITSYEKIIYQFHPTNTLMLEPSFNIAPGSEVVCLMQTAEEERFCARLHWGFIPSWAQDRKKVGSLINARAETVFEKPAFRHAVQSKRCLMLMSGFYEWHQEEGVKQPYFFHFENEALLAVAALWDTWTQGNEVIHSCCLLTTVANSLVLPVHHRMPLILEEEAQAAWLDTSPRSQEDLMRWMHPYEGDDLEGYPVTTLVNKGDFNYPLATQPLSR